MRKNSPTGVFAVHKPIRPTHGVHVATLHLRAHTSSLEHLTFFTQFALRAARALNLPTSNVVALPTRTTLITVPRSPFAHKKSQQNFWRKEHKRMLKVYDGNEHVVQAWLAYLRHEALGGVGMKAQLFTYREVGWGRKMVEDASAIEQEQGYGQEQGEMEGADEVKALAAELEKELAMSVEHAEAQEQELAVGTLAAGEETTGERRQLDEIHAAPEESTGQVGAVQAEGQAAQAETEGQVAEEQVDEGQTGEQAGQEQRAEEKPEAK